MSDAVEPPANNKYCSSQRRSNGFLRRPEVLETVYSVEEDADGTASDGNNRPASADADEEDNNNVADDEAAAAVAAKTQRHSSDSAVDRPKLRDLYGSFERLAQHEDVHEANNTLPNAQRTRDESQQAQVINNFFLF